MSLNFFYFFLLLACLLLFCVWMSDEKGGGENSIQFKCVCLCFQFEKSLLFDSQFSTVLCVCVVFIEHTHTSSIVIKCVMWCDWSDISNILFEYVRIFHSLSFSLYSSSYCLLIYSLWNDFLCLFDTSVETLLMSKIFVIVKWCVPFIYYLYYYYIFQINIYYIYEWIGYLHKITFDTKKQVRLFIFTYLHLNEWMNDW